MDQQVQATASSASDRLRLAINTVRAAVNLFASALKLYKERYIQINAAAIYLVVT
jgi:hypothetical protein